MDTKKLPLSMLVALGLAPGCDDIGCMTRPCLNIAEPPPDDAKKTPPEDEKKTPPEDEKKTPPDPEMTPCLSPPEPDPKAGPCLDVNVCLSPMPDPPPDPPTPKKSGGMARSDVLDRLQNVLPPDVASRLRGRA